MQLRTCQFIKLHVKYWSASSISIKSRWIILTLMHYISLIALYSFVRVLILLCSPVNKRLAKRASNMPLIKSRSTCLMWSIKLILVLDALGCETNADTKLMLHKVDLSAVANSALVVHFHKLLVQEGACHITTIIVLNNWHIAVF